MPRQTPITLNHFAIVRFTDAYWALAPAARAALRRVWLHGVGATAEALHLYQLFGLEACHDLVVWTAVRATEPGVPGDFFARWAAAFAPHRHLVAVSATLWGFTRPSQYTRTRSIQELDPFAPERQPYLVVYPFVKTAGWYGLDRATRQGLMGEHIKSGKQYPDITQLLLYSYGLQDQEFVVVYEMQDLLRFLNLVQELRATRARPYTQRDWPLHAGRLQRGLTDLDPWL